MIERRILTKLLERRELPTLPEIVHEILDAVEDEEASASDVTVLLENDHAISARVLRLANSAFFGLRYRVESIRRAVVVVGFEAVRNLALATSVFDALTSRDQFALDPEDFWKHSLGAAKAAQILPLHHRVAESTAGCFTAGLLHDIGKYVLALVLGEEYREVVEAARASQRPLRYLEREKLNTTHVEVGSWIADKWRFPPLIADVIANQEHAATYSGRSHTEVAVVALADGLSRMAGFGCAGDWTEPACDPLVLDRLGMDAAALEGILDDLGQAREEVDQFLGLLKT